jgi:hypothetical protein
MTDDHYQSLQRWFTAHVRTFREPDPEHQRSIDLKEGHTQRVCAITERIATGLGLAANSRRLAATIALFHDLGRFLQYQRYRTFRDPDSENHAKLSIRQLDRHQVLHGLEPTERLLVKRAIIFHNRPRLPGHLDPATQFHSRLIRDADKVDILRVMVEEFAQPDALRNPVVSLGLAAESGVRDVVYQHLFHGRLMNYQELYNINEFKVLLMSWVFDINFRPTFEILRQRDAFGAIAVTLPNTPSQQQAWALINAHIDRCLAEPKGDDPRRLVS